MLIPRAFRRVRFQCLVVTAGTEEKIIERITDENIEGAFFARQARGGGPVQAN